MAIGPGKYDDLCTTAREASNAQAVLLVVIDGAGGSGFSVQTVGLDLTTRLPAILCAIAQEIEDSFTPA